jgi:hypothetical protein
VVLALTGLSACRHSDVLLSALSVERARSGDIVIHFDAGEELIGRNPSPQVYLRVKGGSNRPLPEKGTGWHGCASLEAVSPKEGAKAFRYACRFPAQALKTGRYTLAGADQENRVVVVETPYSLIERGEYTLEFWLLGNIPDGPPNVIESRTMVLTYRFP